MERESERVMTDTEIILIYAVRYALGRQSYAVSLVTHYVKDEMYRLSRQCRITILCDIAEQKAFGYGDVIDERDWMSLKKRLELSLN